MTGQLAVETVDGWVRVHRLGRGWAHISSWPASDPLAQFLLANLPPYEGDVIP